MLTPCNINLASLVLNSDNAVDSATLNNVFERDGAAAYVLSGMLVFTDDAIGIAIVSRQSVRLSVRPSVTLMYRGRICWVSSKAITPVISLVSSLLGAATSAGVTRTIRFGWNRVGLLFSAENPQYL